MSSTDTHADRRFGLARSVTLPGPLRLDGGVLRNSEAPTVETYILPSGNAPSGTGEPGTPVIAPAVANALLALNGQATTSLPFVKA